MIYKNQPITIEVRYANNISNCYRIYISLIKDNNISNNSYRIYISLIKDNTIGTYNRTINVPSTMDKTIKNNSPINSLYS